MRWITVVLQLLIGCVVLHQGECCTQGWLAFENQCILIAGRPLLVYWGAVMQCYARNSLVVAVSSESMRKFLEVHTSSGFQRKFWVNLKSEEPTGILPSMPEECHYFEDGVVHQVDCDERYFFAAKICSRPKPTHDPIENCLQGSTQHSFVGEWTGRCVFRTPAASAYGDARSNCAGHGGRFMTLPEVIQDGLNDYNKHHVMMNDGLKYWTDLKTNGTSIDPIWDIYIQRNATNFVRGKGECVTVSYRFNNTQNVILLHQTDCSDHAYAMCSTEFSGTTHAITRPAYSTISTMHQPYSTHATTNEHFSTRVTADQPHSSQSTTHQPDSSIATTQQSDIPFYRTTQREATGSCPIGHNWKVYKGNCFWETSFETSRMSWDDARIHCQAYGGDLASFHSKDEEMIGLSFQYGSHPHPYWTGLRLNRDTETYRWSDDSPLDYLNWAPGHPNHKDKLLECVSFDAQDKHWISSLCGMLSWFVCKVPKRINAPIPVIPKVTPVPRCDETAINQFYFQDYCYSFVGTPHTWHRAEEYCENQGSKLVSIHSVEEIGFLLRIIYDAKSFLGTRIWIGLNSFRNGVLRWTDHSPVDFTFEKRRTGTMGNTEKCYSMFVGNGVWSDDTCNEPMGFICKQPKNTSDTFLAPSTPDPTIGNCKKGWHDHHDRCYLPVGYVEKEKRNWTEASSFCESQGGQLVSIRERREQAFLSYLMQGLEGDAWIGLHDTISSGRYYWLDDSDIRYTNWALGEPSFFGIQEDCVKMVYDSLDSGEWKDDVCNKKLAFICYADKDPVLPKPDYNRGLSCLYPPDWLKLGNMCFKMYAGSNLTWKQAESACRKEGAHLISISNTQIQAVATYLGLEVNQTFWIGLQYFKDTQQFEWQNEHPFSITKWGKDEPSYGESLCYASTSDGRWGKFPCEEGLSYICQISPGKPPPQIAYTGVCPNTSENWVSSDGNYCYFYGNMISSWFHAHINCIRSGGDLISFHSMEELEMIRKYIIPKTQKVFIGLMRNVKGGFSWTNLRPVNFINWDEGEPSNERMNCVEMMTDTLKWRLVKCDVAKSFICSSAKDQLIYYLPGKDKTISDSKEGLSTPYVLAIAFGCVIMFVALVVLLRPALQRFCYFNTYFKNPFRERSVSYENSLYNVDEASMELQNESL